MIERLIFSAETGAELRREVSESAPEVEPGEEWAEVPRSAMGPEPQTAWSAEARAFIDVPLVDGPMLMRLLRPEEIALIVATPALYPVLFQWFLLLHAGQPQRVTSALHQAGAAAMLEEGALTQARYEEFAAGIPFTPS